MSADRHRVCMYMNALMDFLSREEPIPCWHEKMPASGQHVLDCLGEGSSAQWEMLFWIHLVYKQKQGSKKERKEREKRGTWWMCH